MLLGQVLFVFVLGAPPQMQVTGTRVDTQQGAEFCVATVGPFILVPAISRRTPCCRRRLSQGLRPHIPNLRWTPSSAGWRRLVGLPKYVTPLKHESPATVYYQISNCIELRQNDVLAPCLFAGEVGGSKKQNTPSL